ARTLYEDADFFEHGGAEENYPLMRAIFGDNWMYEETPTKPNPKYEYLCRIVDAVKAALTAINQNEQRNNNKA
ncbi:hypothetical protein, partial [Nitrosomonas sp.]|uniref:hypothetical protein n=1 Tax=Nitrosomonas sp. TaxID=42353 RepID=UPI001D686084